MRTALRLAILAACLSAAGSAGAASIPVDLELVIAVDVSRSMDVDEFGLQRSGYVAAIRSPDFINAVRSGDHRRIALTYVEWADRNHQKVVVPWRLIDGADAARAFAAALEAEPLEFGRGTSISTAIQFASAYFDANDYDGARRVIDVSGDGPNNFGPPVTEARDQAVAAGIVINGLPILIRPSPIVPDIVGYYSVCVIGGPGAFVLPINKVEEFEVAIRHKLVLEVAALPAAQIIPVSAEAPVDCLVGEKARDFFTGRYYPGLDN